MRQQFLPQNRQDKDEAEQTAQPLQGGAGVARGGHRLYSWLLNTLILRDWQDRSKTGRN
jgi:hypothetical protein